MTPASEKQKQEENLCPIEKNALNLRAATLWANA
jgi:hypothetical protein